MKMSSLVYHLKYEDDQHKTMKPNVARIPAISEKCDRE